MNFLTEVLYFRRMTKELQDHNADPLADPVRSISTAASVTFVRVIAIVFVLLLLWAAISEVDRVTRGSGRIVSQEKNSLVQHLEGGIITQVLVKEGDDVNRGDVIMRIESSFAEAELASSSVALANARLKRHRLRAEAQGLSQLDIGELELEADKDQIALQQRLFERRQLSKKETLSILDEQVAQKEVEISEKESALNSKRRERGLMAERLKSLRQLAEEGAVARNELLQNETQFEGLDAEVSELEHQVRQTRGSLAEVMGRRREAEANFQAEAERELVETELEIAKLEQTISALSDRQNRFDVLASTTGRINKLYVSTVNGVVRGGQTLAEIVPRDAPIAVEAKISPKDRAKVYVGLKAIVKVSAYDFTRFGGLTGNVVEVSPDALQDEQGNFYFRVKIEASSDQLGDGNQVVPGMLAEVDIISGRQTILDYILTPIQRLQENSFRE